MNKVERDRCMEDFLALVVLVSSSTRRRGGFIALLIVYKDIVATL